MNSYNTLPMSNAAKAQHGLGSEQLTVNSKNEHLPTHDFHIGQSIYVSKTPSTEDGIQPQSQTFCKNLEVARSEQMMV